MGSTEQRLLETARGLFNEHGVELVGARELARALKLSPGNVSYYFPKKEDLVRALMAELRALNDRTLSALGEEVTIAAFLTRYRVTFENQYRYRFLPRGIIHLTEAYPALGADYRAGEAARRQSLAAALQQLRRVGELEATDEQAISRMVAVCTLTARFWLSEYRLTYPELPVERVIDHYLALIAHALLPHATRKAKPVLAPFLGKAVPAEKAKPPRRQRRS